VYVLPVKLAREWSELTGRLPAAWVDAQARLHLADPAQLDRATALLGPVQATRSPDDVLSFRVAGDGSGPTTAQAQRVLELLDRAGIEGTIELAATTRVETELAPAPAAPRARPVPHRLPEAWDAELATLPADWSDLLAEVELDSSDYLERAALHLSPINPRRDGDRLALRFRCARIAGYGASPGMVRRCLERCDENGIVGHVRALRVLSDTRPVQTQGPVWQISGQTA
jgi:hypothetical protein